MLKSTRNQIFKIIDKCGLGIENFKMEDSKEGYFEMNTIKYRDTPFEFCIRISSDNFELFDYRYRKFAPKYPITKFEPRVWIPFEEVAPVLEKWLNQHLKKYLQEELENDLWEEYKTVKKSLNFDSIDFESKDFFTTDEQKEVFKAITGFKQLIQENFDSNSKEQRIINERLDYLIQASARLNKFDWKSLVLSTLIGISTTLSLDTAKGQQLFDMFKKAFYTVTHFINN